MKPIEWRGQARRDAADAAWWYALEGGLPLGERFLAQVDATLDLIARHPASGSLRHAEIMSELPAPMRFFPVHGFETYVAYYIELPDHVEVLRVWNVARGLEALTSPSTSTPD